MSATYLFEVIEEMRCQNTKKQLIADQQIQGGLIKRVCVYWMSSVFVTLAVVFGVSFLENGSFDEAYRFVLPALIAAAISLPLAIADLLTFSNRFAGPLVNFRRKFKKMADGQPAERLKFRPDDFLEDICEDFNRLRDRLLDNKFQSQQRPVEEPVER